MRVQPTWKQQRCGENRDLSLTEESKRIAEGCWAYEACVDTSVLGLEEGHSAFGLDGFLEC